MYKNKLNHFWDTLCFVSGCWLNIHIRFFWFLSAAEVPNTFGYLLGKSCRRRVGQIEAKTDLWTSLKCISVRHN